MPSPSAHPMLPASWDRSDDDQNRELPEPRGIRDPDAASDTRSGGSCRLCRGACDLKSAPTELAATC